MNNNLNETPNNLAYMQNDNYPSNNGGNNKNKKNILILAIIVVVLLGFIVFFSILSTSTKKAVNNNHQQNQLINNAEDIVENNDQSSVNEIENYGENEEPINNDDTYLPNTKIVKRSLGQISTFDTGISITVTNSIEYVDDVDFYHKPRFIKVEISNNSNKKFYQNSIAYSWYSTYTSNPVEFIQDDYDYTTFEAVPIYTVDGELKTESSGCVLRKSAYTDTGKSDGKGGFSEINYFVLKPGEKTTAYLLCYFRESIEGAEIKTIYLHNEKNEFMYFMD